MSNLFQDVLQDAQGVQNKLLGPTYPYYTNIKTPQALGMSNAGNITTMARDINGLINYAQVLVSGNSSASSTGGPLGNKFFLQTGAKCQAIDASNALVDRYIYIDNVPSGDIPFISQCQPLTMQTIDISNNVSSETQYVTLIDIQNMDPCTFPNGVNPITNVSCKEVFQSSISENASPVEMPVDPLAQLYFACLTGVGLYILYRFMDKAK
jgi:hypothetical protein